MKNKNKTWGSSGNSGLRMRKRRRKTLKKNRFKGGKRIQKNQNWMGKKIRFFKEKFLKFQRAKFNKKKKKI